MAERYAIKETKDGWDIINTQTKEAFVKLLPYDLAESIAGLMNLTFKEGKIDALSEVCIILKEYQRGINDCL